MNTKEDMPTASTVVVWRDRSIGFLLAILFLVGGGALISGSITSAALCAAAGIVICAVALAVRDQIRGRRSDAQL